MGRSLPVVPPPKPKLSVLPVDLDPYGNRTASKHSFIWSMLGSPAAPPKCHPCPLVTDHGLYHPRHLSGLFGFRDELTVTAEAEEVDSRASVAFDHLINTDPSPIIDEPPT